MRQAHFCLLGTWTPLELIRDKDKHPFDIGRRIELDDFSAREAALLCEPLSQDPTLAQALFARVLYWTNGHPYLTQRLCQAVAEEGNAAPAGMSPGLVDVVCEQLFLHPRAREGDPNLVFVRESVLNPSPGAPELLDKYRKVYCGEAVRNDESDHSVNRLRQAGIVNAVEGRLQLRNRIYAAIFDQKWMASLVGSLPNSQASLRRVRPQKHRPGMIL